MTKATPNRQEQPRQEQQQNLLNALRLQMAIIMPTNNPNSSNQTGQPTNGERRQVSSKACVLSIIKDALALLDDDD